jgi:hypothetical protein
MTSVSVARQGACQTFASISDDFAPRWESARDFSTALATGRAITVSPS